MNIARMEKFESIWAVRHDLPAESLAQYRFESREGYRLPELAAHYRTFVEALSEAESLRKDAERYRWTSIEGNWVARMFGKWRAHVGEYGDAQPTDWYPSREEAIDAAMSVGK